MQIIALAKQISPNNNKFIMDAYRHATEKPHGYLLFNLQQHTKEHLIIRDSFFPKEAHFYVDRKDFTVTNLENI